MRKNNGSVFWLFRKKTIFLLFLLVLLTIFLIFKTDVLKMDQVEWEAKNAACLDKTRIKSEINLQKQYFFYINKNKTFEQVVSLYPCVKNLTWERKFIRGMKITAVGRIPLVKITSLPKVSVYELTASPSSSTALLDWSLPIKAEKIFLADNEGYVFDTDRQSQLPTLYDTEDEIKLGRKIEDNVLGKLEQVILNLEKLQIPAQDEGIFKFKKSDNILLVYSRPKLVLSLSGEILRQLGSLQLILQKAKIDGKEMETVDLRFDKPVVVYSSRQSHN